MSCNIIHAKCEKSAADDKSLPRNAYLVTYVEKDKMTYDIVMADSKVDVFDQYWDKYKEGLHPKEADIVIAVKDGDLEDMYDVPFEVVEEAYPDIEWGGRS